MQPISTMRWPCSGSSPVVSVSNIISRIAIPNPATAETTFAESLSTTWHCSNRGKHRTHLCARRLGPLRGVHHKIGAAALLGVRHLLGKDCCAVLRGHAGTCHYSLYLHL